MPETAPPPEHVVTATSKVSSRPAKRRALTPVSQQQAAVEALFAQPERQIDTTAPSQRGKLAPPPEIVANVQGSSAGAGSGEFHVYKAARRRENERLSLMDQEKAKEKADEEFAKKQEERRKADDAKTAKNKARRDKRKNKGKAKGANGEANAVEGSEKTEGKKGITLIPRIVKNGEEERLTEGGEVQSVEEIGIVIHDED